MSFLNQSLNNTNNQTRSMYNKTGRSTRVMSLQGTQSFQRGDLGKGTLRQAGMTSIYKGIQTIDVQKITGKENKSLLPTIRRGSFVYQLDEKSTDRGNIHKNLISTRKKYDELKDQVKKAQAELDQLRGENDMLKKRENEMENQQMNVEVSSAYEQDMGMAKSMYEDSYWQYKSYQHMRRRLKDDAVSYEVKINNVKEELRQLDISLDEAQKQAYKTFQFRHQTQKVMEQMIYNIEEEQIIREDELEQFKEDLRKKQQVQRQNEERQQKQKFISEHAMHDKDGTEKKWRQLLLVHMFVNQMFKAKMSRELKKFETVEKAYQKIKQATGVTDGQVIVEKFLTREQTYGELLASIAEYEKRIEQLNTQKEQNNSKLEDLKQEMNDMEMNKKTKVVTVGLDQDLLKKMDNVDERLQRVELEKERMYQWCIKVLTKLHRIEKLKVQKEEREQKMKQEMEEALKRQQEEGEEGEEGEQSQEKQESQEDEGSNQKPDENVADVQQLQKKVHEERVNFYEQFPRENIIELLSTTLEKLNVIKQESQVDEVKIVQTQLDKADYQSEIKEDMFITRNVRTKPPVRKRSIKKVSQVFSQSSQGNEEQVNESQSESYLPEQNSHESDQEDGFQNELEEQEYVQMLREDIIRDRDIGNRKKKLEDDKRRADGGKKDGSYINRSVNYQ